MHTCLHLLVYYTLPVMHARIFPTFSSMRHAHLQNRHWVKVSISTLLTRKLIISIHVSLSCSYYQISVLFSGIDVKNSNFGGRARWVNMITLHPHACP